MNCAQSQDLLLDLAYGELEPGRLAELEAHVAGCATCRAEKAHIDRTRQMAAALRDLEEPSAKFDEPILRAARAEAGMQADGTPGPVVEVAATVKPLGLQAARLDPHARVRGDARQRPWWRRRAAAVGSAAVAAGLAIVVSVSVTRQQEANRLHEEVRPITVRAPQAVVPHTFDDALAKREQPAASKSAAAGDARRERQAPAAEPAPAQQDAAPKKLAKASQDEAASVKDAQPTRKKEAARADVSERKVAEHDGARSPPSTAAPVESTSANSYSAPAIAPVAPAAAPERARTRVAVAERDAPPAAPQEPVRPVADARSAAASGAPPAPVASGGALGGVAAGMNSSAQRKPDAPPRIPEQLEDDASAARRAGDYARAAALYKQAAALRTSASPAQAAWDMAHAVECLAAGGNVADAIETRQELLRSFPQQRGPRAAADSALRAVPLPPDRDTAPPK